MLLYFSWIFFTVLFILSWLFPQVRYLFASKRAGTRLDQGRDFEGLETSNTFKREAGLFKETRKSDNKKRGEINKKERKEKKIFYQI